MSISALYGALKNNGDEKWDHLKKVNFYLYLTFLHNPLDLVNLMVSTFRTSFPQIPDHHPRLIHPDWPAHSFHHVTKPSKNTPCHPHIAFWPLPTNCQHYFSYICTSRDLQPGANMIGTISYPGLLCSLRTSCDQLYSQVACCVHPNKHPRFCQSTKVFILDLQIFF